MVWEDDPFNNRGESSLGVGLATLVIGAAIGAVAALFLAPKTGQQLRSQIADTAGSWKDQAAEALAQGRERVVSAVEHGHPTGDGPADRVSERV
jgi:gas vesicle protein